MKIKIIAVGTNMPTWVKSGSLEYLNRLPRHFSVAIHEIPLLKRPKNGPASEQRKKESALMLKAIPKAAHVVALDVLGASLSSEKLAESLTDQKEQGHMTCLLVGGPEGLSEACLSRADSRWSLSALTLPHPLVRLVLSEALYRAYTIIEGHPYHK